MSDLVKEPDPLFVSVLGIAIAIPFVVAIKGIHLWQSFRGLKPKKSESKKPRRSRRFWAAIEES